MSVSLITGIGEKVTQSPDHTNRTIFVCCVCTWKFVGHSWVCVRILIFVCSCDLYSYLLLEKSVCLVISMCVGVCVILKGGADMPRAEINLLAKSRK